MVVLGHTYSAPDTHGVRSPGRIALWKAPRPWLPEVGQLRPLSGPPSRELGLSVLWAPHTIPQQGLDSRGKLAKIWVLGLRWVCGAPSLWPEERPLSCVVCQQGNVFATPCCVTSYFTIVYLKTTPAC